MSTGFGAVDQIDLEDFLSLSSGSLDTFLSEDATSGSAISQTFTAEAGDTVSFFSNFLTDEFTPTAFNDSAFYSLTSLDLLADTFSPVVASLTPFNEETGFTLTEIVLPTSGTFTLGFGVVDVGDTVVDSALLVDDVTVTPVPEPATLLGLMSVGLAALYRRKGKTVVEEA